MSLPTPTLDDRRFQDIVDEVKQLIPRHCPEWTDHNVSDPGIALVELFAWMTDMLLYRLNQVPDRLYAKFLELMGVSLYSAAPARTELLFWLAGPQPEPVRIPAGTQVGTVRTGQDQSVVFMTDEAREIVQPKLVTCLTAIGGERFENRWNDLRLEEFAVPCFPSVEADDAVLFGFEQSLAGNIVRLDITASVESVGVDPEKPPWVWEAWSGEEWTACRLIDDTTVGLNAPGAIRLILPPQHVPLTVGPEFAHWLRCRLLPPGPGREDIRASPQIYSLKAVGLGGVAAAHHGQSVAREPLGHSDGRPDQRFAVRRTPVLPRRPGETVQLVTRDAVTEWTEVRDFAASTSDDLHFTWDGATGEIAFGPRVRHADGSVHQHGAVPELDVEVVASAYRHGGGARGNVGAGTLTVLKSSIPFIARVENLDSAHGGVDAERVEDAKVRGPLSLRSGDRAVTASDFERLTLEAEPRVARARCRPPEEAGGPLRVLIVPLLHIAPERLELDDLALPDDLVERVAGYLDERRVLTTAVEIRTPSYQGVTVLARVNGAASSRAELVRDRVLQALYAYINPLSGGPDGTGWAFGRDLNVGEVFALLSSVGGVQEVVEVRLFMADLRRGERREGRQRVRLPADALFASFQHQVLVR